MSDILLTDTNILYLRDVSLVVAPSVGPEKDLSNLRVSFDVTKTNESNPNRAKIRVYNLSEATRSLVEGDQTRVVLMAGYINTKATIFQGDITKSIHKYQGVDIVTEIEAGDGNNRFRNARIDRGYPPGTTNAQLVQEFEKELGIPVSAVQGIPDFQYANGITFSGLVRDQLNDWAKKNDLEWSIQDETLQIIPKNLPNTDDIVLLNNKSGLIGSPEKTKGGVEFESLLQPKLRPGRRVKIESKFVNGLFKVRKVTHAGDSHEGTFISKCEATA